MNYDTNALVAHLKRKEPYEVIVLNTVEAYLISFVRFGIRVYRPNTGFIMALPTDYHLLETEAITHGKLADYTNAYTNMRNRLDEHRRLNPPQKPIKIPPY